MTCAVGYCANESVENAKGVRKTTAWLTANMIQNAAEIWRPTLLWRTSKTTLKMVMIYG